MSGDEPELEGPKGFRSRFNAYRSVFLAGVPSNVNNPIDLDLEVFDTLDEFTVGAAHTFRPRRAGFYAVSCQVFSTSVIVGRNYVLSFGIIPATLLVQVPVLLLQTRITLGFSTVLYLTPANEYRAWTSHGVALDPAYDYQGGLGVTYLAAHRLS